MKILIVHAHHEPQSFSSALFQQSVKTLESAGHQVMTSDLYAMKFDPVSDRRNFTSVKDAGYLKQQVEETLASETGGFEPSLEAEIQKLEAADLLIFNFPIWWFGMPGILKGWVDKVFASSRIYGGEKLYEGGLGGARKKALVVMTTGGGPDVYGGYGVNPPMNHILEPVHHGVFWFNGFLPMEPFIAWSPARATPEQRQGYLDALSARLLSIETSPTMVLPPLADFPNWGKENKSRFMVTVTRTVPLDANLMALIPAEQATVADLKRRGIILSAHYAPPAQLPWKGFLVMRETHVEAVQKHLETLPLAKYLFFEITQLAQL